MSVDASANNALAAADSVVAVRCGKLADRGTNWTRADVVDAAADDAAVSE